MGRARVDGAPVGPSLVSQRVLRLCAALTLLLAFSGGGTVTGAAASTSTSSAADCKAQGFAESLMCSGCDRLAAALSASSAEAQSARELLAECRNCCTAEETGKAAVVYAEATLEVCQ
jgi:hypothetical protein